MVKKLLNQSGTTRSFWSFWSKTTTLKKNHIVFCDGRHGGLPPCPYPHRYPRTTLRYQGPLLEWPSAPGCSRDAGLCFAHHRFTRKRWWASRSVPQGAGREWHASHAHEPGATSFQPCRATTYVEGGGTWGRYVRMELAGVDSPRQDEFAAASERRGKHRAPPRCDDHTHAGANLRHCSHGAPPPPPSFFSSPTGPLLSSSVILRSAHLQFVSDLWRNAPPRAQRVVHRERGGGPGENERAPPRAPRGPVLFPVTEATAHAPLEVRANTRVSILLPVKPTLEFPPCPLLVSACTQWLHRRSTEALILLSRK